MRLNHPPLLELLSYCRPHGSATEQEFVERYLLNLPGAITDAHGNVHVRIGAPDILWSCHTDTVHRVGERQNVRRANGQITLSAHSSSACLGGDDTVGVYICLALIDAGREGHYIFHRGEECGGIGSKALAQDTPDLIHDSTFAIALDRAGTSDIITSQCGQPCCSGAFAQSLSAALAPTFKQDKRYRPACGIYTDTHEYRRLIPECTNISVGYYHAHTSQESVDTRHVERLIKALCDLDAQELVCRRDPQYTSPRPESTWRSRQPRNATVKLPYGWRYVGAK
jgi:hypothetical protein